MIVEREDRLVSPEREDLMGSRVIVGPVDLLESVAKEARLENLVSQALTVAPDHEASLDPLDPQASLERADNLENKDHKDREATEEIRANVANPDNLVTFQRNLAV